MVPPPGRTGAVGIGNGPAILSKFMVSSFKISIFDKARLSHGMVVEQHGVNGGMGCGFQVIRAHGSGDGSSRSMCSIFTAHASKTKRSKIYFLWNGTGTWGVGMGGTYVRETLRVGSSLRKQLTIWYRHYADCAVLEDAPVYLVVGRCKSQLVLAGADGEVGD